jgi:ATP-dependent DNA ligase
MLRSWPSCAERHITCNATEELKLDGYRAVAAKTAGRVKVCSRNENDFGQKYPAIAAALATLPDDTVVDGEIVALDPEGRPSLTRCKITDRIRGRSSITPLGRFLCKGHKFKYFHY